MVNEGPTTVGSIVGKLRLDDSDWNATLTAAEARARALGQVDPKIEVDARVDEAMAKLRAVEKQVGKLTSENERLRASLNGVNDSNSRGLRHWQVIAILIASLIPLLGPLSAYVVGVGVAFVGMGAAGVAAIFGIKHAMEEGTAEGQRYSAGLRTLKDNLSDLADTSATSMLVYFEQAVTRINRAMPFLNQQTAFFSRMLGASGNNLLSTLITSLQVLDPLLRVGAIHIRDLTTGLNEWASNGGLQQFADFALRNFPQVARTLGDIAMAALHLIEATAPIGTVMLAMFSAVANVINALPVDVLTAFVAVGAGAILTFKAWGFIAPMLAGVANALGAVGVASTISAGPLGWLIAGVGALVSVVAVATSMSQSAVEVATSYAEAVERDAGAIGDATRAQAAKNLEDGEAFALGEKLGLSTRIITDAVLGNAEALEQVEAAQRAAIDAVETGISQGRLTSTHLNQQYVANQRLDEIIRTQTVGIDEQIDSYNRLQEAVGGTTIETEAQFEAITRLAASYGMTVSEYQAAQVEGQKTADQLRATTNEMIAQNDAAGLLRQGLDLLNGGSLDVAAAQTGLAAANNTLLRTFKDNGDAIIGNSEAAVANQQAIQRSVQAAQTAAAAIAEQTDSTLAGKQAYIESKTALEDQLRAQGNLTAEVQAYIDQLYAVDALEVPPTKLDVDTSAADAKLDAFEARLKKTLGAQATAQSLQNAGIDVFRSPYAVYKASGGTIEGGGGTVRGPGSWTSDSVPMWASVGEEVIRGAAASFMGVRPLLKSLNADPAGTMTRLASSGNSVHAPITVLTASPAAAAIEVQRRLERSAA